MKIGITQRIHDEVKYKERRDCIDQKWVELLEKLGHHPVLIPNSLQEPDDWSKKSGIEGLILSGGNDVGDLTRLDGPAPERDRTELILLNWAKKNRIPLLGVCRGMQMINKYLGGRHDKINDHVACRHKIFTTCGDDLFGTFSFVNSYHNYGIFKDGLGEGLVPRAWIGDYIEAFSHEYLNWLGIMWHPEREYPYMQADINLLKLFFMR